MISKASGKQHFFIFFLIALPIIFVLFSCNRKNKSEPVIIDYSTREARDQFQTLNLDSIYTNLLGSEKNEAEADSLYQSWLAFNNELAQMIRDKHFDWGTSDSSVILWNRVYCHGDGTIDYYLYFIRDSLVNKQVGENYAEFIRQNISNLKYPVIREFKYAQCGSFRHKNYD